MSTHKRRGIGYLPVGAGAPEDVTRGSPMGLATARMVSATNSFSGDVPEGVGNRGAEGLPRPCVDAHFIVRGGCRGARILLHGGVGVWGGATGTRVGTCGSESLDVGLGGW